jgi:hypothetical protein
MRSIRDSAGVKIVDIRLPAVVPAITIGTRPIATLGGTRTDPDEELSTRDGVLSVVRAGETFIVADQGRIVRFDSAGTLLHVLARTGDGPGEIRSVSGLCFFAGDTLVALDYTLRRASIFDPKGRYVRAFTLPGNARRQACLGDGRIVAEAGPRRTAAELGHTAPFALIDTRSAKVSPLGELPVDWTGLFSRMASVVAMRSEIYTAGGFQMAYNVHDSLGRLRMGVRTNVAGKPVPRGEAERLLNAAVPAGQKPEAMKRARDFLMREPPPKVYQALWRLIVDPNGRVWANETDDKGKPSSWLVFGPDGGLLGRAMVPHPRGASSPNIIAVGSDEIFVQYVDDNGAHTIAVYRSILPPRRR